MTRSASFAVVALCVLLPLVGCGGGGGARERFADVEAVVLLDGSPVDGATITLVPVDEATASSATGTTNASGRAKLLALSPDKPVQGEYFVGVMKAIVPQRAETDSQDESSPSGEPPAEAQLTHVVPQKYNNPRQSGIKVTISPGQKEVRIELSSQ